MALILLFMAIETQIWNWDEGLQLAAASLSAGLLVQWDLSPVSPPGPHLQTASNPGLPLVRSVRAGDSLWLVEIAVTRWHGTVLDTSLTLLSWRNIELVQCLHKLLVPLPANWIIHYPAFLLR